MTSTVPPRERSDIKLSLFSGNSNPELAADIAKELAEDYSDLHYYNDQKASFQHSFAHYVRIDMDKIKPL